MNFTRIGEQRKLSMGAFIIDQNLVDRGKHDGVMDESVKRSQNGSAHPSVVSCEVHVTACRYSDPFEWLHEEPVDEGSCPTQQDHVKAVVLPFHLPLSSFHKY